MEWKEGWGRNGEESWKDEGIKEGRDGKGKREVRKGVEWRDGYVPRFMSDAGAPRGGGIVCL